MNTVSAIEKAKKVFADHPGIDTLFFTSDLMAFFDYQNASDHATKVLNDDLVTTVTLAQVSKESGDGADKDADKEMKTKEAEDKLATLKANLVSKQEAYDAETDDAKMKDMETEINQLIDEISAAEKEVEDLKA